MASIKSVKTVTIEGGSTLKVISAPPTHGLETEDIDVSDFSNATRMESVPRDQLKEGEIALLLEYDGTLVTVGAATPVTLTVVVTKSDGDELTANSVGYFKSAVPVEVAIDGERRLLQNVVFMPNGSNTTTS